MPDTQPVCRHLCPQHISSQVIKHVAIVGLTLVNYYTYTGHEGNIDAIAKVIEASPEFARQLDYSARPGTKTYPRCGYAGRSSMTCPPAHTMKFPASDFWSLP
jgi:hypothetical protein